MSTAPHRDPIPLAGQGRVVWAPERSLWFGGLALASLGAAIPAALRSPSAVALFVAMSVLTLCAGHSVGIHRGLVHRAFRAPAWLEYTLVYVGVLVGLGGPIGLVQMHNTRDFQQNQPRCHDYFAHRRSPWVDCFWNLHCRFEFRRRFDPSVSPEIARDPVLNFLERTWRWQQLPWAVLFLAVGGWPWLVWGTCVRITVGTCGHWFVGYVAHRRGYRAFHNRGAAVQGWNSLLLGTISMGEGWHNNHHTFPRSARIGIRWWELDPGWWLISALRAVGLAREVLVPGDRTRIATANRIDGARSARKLVTVPGRRASSSA
jgi:stearoyl-CoA desaturase (delta-9 desaturase)